MTITRQEFADEGRRIRAYKKAGKSDDWIKGWLRKWREAGDRFAAKESK